MGTMHKTIFITDITFVKFANEHRSEIEECTCGLNGVTRGFSHTRECEDTKSWDRIFKSWCEFGPHFKFVDEDGEEEKAGVGGANGSGSKKR